MEHQNGNTSRDSNATFPPVETCSRANQNRYAPGVLFMRPSYLDRRTPHISERTCTFITFASVLIRVKAPIEQVLLCVTFCLLRARLFR